MIVEYERERGSLNLVACGDSLVLLFLLWMSSFNRELGVDQQGADFITDPIDYLDRDCHDASCSGEKHQVCLSRQEGGTCGVV